MRDHRLEGIKAVVQRQERVFAERDYDRFFFDQQHRRAGSLRAHRRIVNEGSPTPLGDGLLIEPILSG
jgi:hypothetical protein